MFVLRLPFHYLLLCFRFVLFLFNQRHPLFYVFFPLLFRLLAHILCFAFCFFSFLRILFPSLFLLNSYNSFSIIHSDFTKYSLKYTNHLNAHVSNFPPLFIYALFPFQHHPIYAPLVHSPFLALCVLGVPKQRTSPTHTSCNLT